jgi:hypothetical protein
VVLTNDAWDAVRGTYRATLSAGTPETLTLHVAVRRGRRSDLLSPGHVDATQVPKDLAIFSRIVINVDIGTSLGCVFSAARSHW